MPASISLYFRPVDTYIKEISRDNGIPKYQIVTTVNFYTDEAMTSFAYSKQYTFDNIEYTSEWDGILNTLYSLITSNA